MPEGIRRCDDGGRHDGSLELLTWECPDDGTGLGALGWGACFLEESEHLKDKFEVSRPSQYQRNVRLNYT